MLKNQRLKKVVITTAAILAFGIVYYIFVRISGWAVPCIIYKLTGFYCPGCGVTRMFMALVRLDFEAAFQSNLFLMLLLVPSVVFVLHRIKRYVKGEAPTYSKFERILIAIVLIAALIFSLLRNIPAFSFLAPI